MRRIATRVCWWLEREAVMSVWAEARERYLQLVTWERPGRIKGLFDYDIESANLWLRGATWLRGDWVAWVVAGWSLLWQCVAAWLAWSIWSVPLVSGIDVAALFGALWLVQLGWAAAGLRADAWAYGRAASDWPARLLVTWLALLPFALLPGMVIGAACWWLFPVRLHLKVWGGARGNPGLLLVGRFVQYHVVWLLTSQASCRVDDGARFVLDCRSSVFDGLQADLVRYLSPVLWLLSGGAVGMAISMVLAWLGLDSSAASGFETLAVFGGVVVVWAGCGTWATLINLGAQARLGQEWVSGQHKPEPELPSAPAGKVAQYKMLSVFWTGLFVGAGYVMAMVASGESVLEALPVLIYLR